MKEPTRGSNYPEARIGRQIDLDSQPVVGMGRRKEGRRMDTVARHEKDNMPPRKGEWVNAGPPKQTMNNLTCDEADVDELLSAGELT